MKLNNLATLLQMTKRFSEAKPLMLRHLEILLKFTRVTGHTHPYLMAAVDNYANLLQTMGCTKEQIIAELRKVIPEIFQQR
jgi:hypothetical protein